MEKSNVDYKKIILSEAEKIAMKDGITKINIRSVAKNSNIAIGTVYNYFPSKADLLVAVIDDFWQCAFKDIKWKSLGQNSFYANIEKIYMVLHEYLKNFKENWLEQLSLLKTPEKLLGREKETEFFQVIYGRIIFLMDMDNDLKQFQWSEAITKEKIAEFIFQNMLSMLRKDTEDISFFLLILRKILSN